jgi:hypothetical protein
MTQRCIEDIIALGHRGGYRPQILVGDLPHGFITLCQQEA